MSTLTLDVAGMTCAHCVRAVTTELTALDAVAGVTVDLHAGGTTAVTVTTSGDVAEDALRAAVDEAGYELVAVRAGDGRTGEHPSDEHRADAQPSDAQPSDEHRAAATAPVGRTTFSLVAAEATPRTPKPEGHSCGCGCS